ncbi:MAG: Flp pilus assembly complex ATPase component TadA [Oligoflexia bacterium]|nr:Flp pilus assembly complex ATPase component TadA [Oligoflexia bacterium]
MAGILSRLERKGTKAGTAAAELLVRSPATEKLASVNKPSTKVVSTPAELGLADELLAELKAEGRIRKDASRAAAPTSPAHKIGEVLGSQPHTTVTAAGRPSSRIKVVQSQAIDLSHRKRPDIFDEALPWWLTDPVACSPQVDALVPAARLVLNDLISDNVTQEELIASIHKAVSIAADQLSSEIRFSSKDIQESAHELISLIMGKGPLSSLYDDPAVTDIHLDGHNSVKCVRRGQALETPFRFRSPSECEAYISSMLQSVERVLNHSSPIVDCVLDDKQRSRINAVHSSLLDGKESAVVIRIPRLQQISFYDLLRTKTLPATLAAWLSELVACGQSNILVMGPTGSGKTTMTTALLSAVGSDERICTIEDVPEIFVPTVHLEKLVSRPENAQGEGAIGMDQLLRAALRRAPHRIVVGEIRDKEGPLFLKALETGHLGSVATIHADNARDSLWRLLDVVSAYEKAPQESIQRRISRSLHVLISMKKINGRPCLMEVAEVRPPINGEFIVKPIVKFESEVQGRRQWRLMANHSEWIDRLRERGVELQAGPGLLPMEKVGDEPQAEREI